MKVEESVGHGGDVSLEVVATRNMMDTLYIVLNQ